MDPLASAEDLNAWLGREVDETRAEAVLKHASDVIREEAKGQAWLDSEDTDVPDVIVGITVRLAARLLANPSDLTQQSTGPFSSSFGREFLSETDRRILSGSKSSVTRLWALSTTRGGPDVDDLVPVVGSDKPLPVSRDPW